MKITRKTYINYVTYHLPNTNRSPTKHLFFREIDVDGDGTITADEFIQYIKGVNS